MRVSLKIQNLVIIIILVSIFGTLMIFSMSQQSPDFLRIQVIGQNYTLSVFPTNPPVISDHPSENATELYNYSLATQEDITPENTMQVENFPLDIKQSTAT